MYVYMYDRYLNYFILTAYVTCCGDHCMIVHALSWFVKRNLIVKSVKSSKFTSNQPSWCLVTQCQCIHSMWLLDRTFHAFLFDSIQSSFRLLRMRMTWRMPVIVWLLDWLTGRQIDRLTDHRAVTEEHVNMHPVLHLGSETPTSKWFLIHCLIVGVWWMDGSTDRLTDRLIDRLTDQLIVTWTLNLATSDWLKTRIRVTDEMMSSKTFNHSIDWLIVWSIDWSDWIRNIILLVVYYIVARPFLHFSHWLRRQVWKVTWPIEWFNQSTTSFDQSFDR